MEPFIFTECFGCAGITKVALESFVNTHPDHDVHVFGQQQDFDELGEVVRFPNIHLVDCTNDQVLARLYKTGHEGTAYIFAKVLSGEVGSESDRIIHFDGDVFFKTGHKIIETINAAFDDADIIGSRRCYKNNPAGIVVDPNLPDTVSTYCFGIKRSAVPKFDFDYLRRMCGGSVNPLGHDVFDFFDPVTFTALKAGSRITFLDSEIIGGQNEHGSKVSRYKSNLHLDMGSHIAHFGGVGTGLSVYRNLSSPPLSYASWAVGRYALFAKLFFDFDFGFREPCIYGPDGRWVNGGYDESILSLVKSEIYENQNQ